MSSAPGKLLLAGEYAVLAGGACIVSAVDRRVVASRHEGGGYRLIGAEADDALPRSILASAHRPELLNHLCVDVSQLFEGPDKLGLGSSAASSVAITAFATGLTGEALRAAAEAAHYEFQGHSGSGADVAASVFGGLLAYQLPESRLPIELDLVLPPRLRLEALAIPDDLRIEAVWLGKPASSTKMIAELSIHLGEQAVLKALNQIAIATEEMIDGFKSSGSAQVLEAVRESEFALDKLGKLAGIPIVIDAHRRLGELTAGLGMAVKPSGAGGGDFSLVFGRKESDWSFLESLESMGGGKWIPLRIGAR